MRAFDESTMRRFNKVTSQQAAVINLMPKLKIR
jgi:hypothetical protein